ncbi:unnamed protein product [Sphagnum jensenii]|uniref:Beta-1,3-glucanase n=1 Tax=Sphagnum jensenii TaxID=128206 RepID=A0ABP1C0H3_9BRYO
MGGGLGLGRGIRAGSSCFGFSSGASSAMTTCIAMLLLLLCQLLCLRCAEGTVGINYGQVADNLPQPQHVSSLVQQLGFKMVKIYDTNETILNAFANTGTSVVVCVPNDEIISLAVSEVAARTWVHTNINPFFPATKITNIMVGNEILGGDPSIWPALVPAMWQLYSGLRYYNLDDNIKISTPHPMGVLATSYPPSAGTFQPNIATSVMAPLLNFLDLTQSHFMVNVYPYFAYLADGGTHISLNFALIEPNTTGFTDANTGLHYSCLLDAMLDATIYAMKSLNYSDIPLVITESGWPSMGDPTEIGASATNAAIYNNNLIKHVHSQPPLGTPLRPGVAFDTYIFALFNEDLKPGPLSERHWGLFYPNMSQVYTVNVELDSQITTVSK